MKKFKPLTNIRKLIGFTIVELLIGTVLGLLVTSAMVHMFITNKQLIVMTNTFNILQDNIRYTELFLNRNALLSGYRSPPSSTAPQDFSLMNTVYPSSASYIDATDNMGTNGSDTLTIRFQGNDDGTISDCTRTTVNSSAMATNIISINANNELECQATNSSSNPASVDTHVIVDNVEQMQVLLGEDTDNDGYANRYLAPSDNNLALENIVSLRVGIVFRSDDNVTSQQDTKTYTVLDTTWDPADDRRLRKVISKTLQLRNRVGAS